LRSPMVLEARRRASVEALRRASTNLTASAARAFFVFGG
jgi:hypothetical protein